MTYDPEIHHRRSIRLKGYDYAEAGAYFVTICVYGRECLFGEVVEGTVRLNPAGEAVQAVWQGLPEHYPSVVLDAFVVMPNHVHAIVILKRQTGATPESPVGAGLETGAGLRPAPTSAQNTPGIVMMEQGSVGVVSAGMVSVRTVSVGAVSVGAGLRPAQDYNMDRSDQGRSDQGRSETCPYRGHGGEVAPLSEIVRAFKSFSSRHINRLRDNPGVPVWQRNYYERIMRNDDELNRARTYIAENPLKWAEDRENPVNVT